MKLLNLMLSLDGVVSEEQVPQDLVGLAVGQDPFKLRSTTYIKGNIIRRKVIITGVKTKHEHKNYMVQKKQVMDIFNIVF